MATITVTVTDGVDPVPKAEVAFFNSEGRLVTSVRTDSSGVATLILSNGTYTRRVTKERWVSSEASSVVSGDAAQAVSLTALGIADPVEPPKVTLYGEIHSTDGRPLFVVVHEIRASQWNQMAGASPTDKQSFSAFVWGPPRRVMVRDGSWSITLYAGSMVRVACSEIGLDTEGLLPSGAGPYQLSELIPRQVSPPHMHTGENPGFSGSMGS